MELGFYSAAALLSAQEMQHEMASRNITASSQAGSRQLMVGVTGSISGQMTLPGSFDSMLQGQLPKAETQINLTQGAIRQTGNPYNIANAGEGFFEVTLPGGQSLYTRNGAFHLSPEAKLVDGYGRPVMGKDGPIQLSSTGGDFYCDRQGQLFQGAKKIGQLSIVNVPVKSLLSAAGGFIINPDKGGVASAVEKPSVIQNAIEEGNHSTVDGMISLIEISRYQELAQKVLQTHDERSAQVVKTFGNLA